MQFASSARSAPNVIRQRHTHGNLVRKPDAITERLPKYSDTAQWTSQRNPLSNGTVASSRLETHNPAAIEVLQSFTDDGYAVERPSTSAYKPIGVA